ncbi:TIGR03016 family PEP-CTERM system-associated outer membrane protein [Pseudoduganella namucuonensis]|uniref:Uncharacterized protein, PEP-CTERM system associated n=1 Tax=Pseudoduganella namucuonensis TaxID=1035707 RepID=A0A1I7GFS8_9BURK|nr:TIGR03016 family PEP-CTERM system-associated outer membrane protein [Pseudoduganella namucuonensis]SFU47290.1 uncharacterized protein, PEP-CTERM system associated [Pseudoduganella namucuonensis]
MTTTTVKPRLPAARPLAAAVAVAVLPLAPASHAAWKFTPQLEVRESYTDNVAASTRELAQAQWVTSFAPGFTLETDGPRVQAKIGYNKHLYKFKDANVGGARDSDQQLNAHLHANLVNDLLFLDTDATTQQHSASAFGPLLSNTITSFASANANEVKTLRIAPYLKHRFGSIANAELRYTRDRVETDNMGFGRSDSNNVMLNATSGTAFRQLGWALNYQRQQLDTQSTRSLGGASPGPQGTSNTTDNLNTSLRYLYSPTLTLTASAGYDKYDYDALGGVTQGKSWSAGVTWLPSPRTSIQATAGKRYYGNSYSLNAQHRSRASVWIISYNDAVTTTRQQFLLPSAIDTAAMLDRLFAAAIPDAAARRQAVDAYILSTGLPPSLANSINYFSNRYMLQKQLQASAAFNTPRTSTILSLQSARRDGLSSSVVDSGLLGVTNSALNDNTRQSGASIIVNWRLSSRTGINFTADYMHVESLTVERTDINRSLRLNLTRELRPKLRGQFELRHVEGSTSARVPYTENAVSASLNKQF